MFVNLIEESTIYIYICILLLQSLRRCLTLLTNTDQTRQLLEEIDSAELYLKARFRMHCTNDDSCISHCIDHALSHPTDIELTSECNNIHDRYCKECCAITESIDLLKVMLAKLSSSHERDVAFWDVANCKQKIFEWKKHILRGVQQSKARSEKFRELEPSSALWIRDYAQKVNPSKVSHNLLIVLSLSYHNLLFCQTLESMTEYFGKRGITVSVEVFLMKQYESYRKQVWVLIAPTKERWTHYVLPILSLNSSRKIIHK